MRSLLKYAGQTQDVPRGGSALLVAGIKRLLGWSLLAQRSAVAVEPCWEEWILEAYCLGMHCCDHHQRREPKVTREYIHTHTYTYVHIHTHTYTYIHIHTHTYTYIHTHTYIHIHTHTHTYTYTYIHIHTHTYTYIHVHTHTYTYIHTYIHIKHAYSQEGIYCVISWRSTAPGKSG